MYGKRKRSQFDSGSQGALKRYAGGRNPYFRPARSWSLRPRGRGAHFGRKASTAFIRQPSSLPDRLYVKLKYREQLSFGQASGNLADNVYRGNSLFDPDLTGTGGQPLGFDQWAAFYASYTVLASECKVTSMLNGSVAPNNLIHGVVPTLFSNALGTGEQERADEFPYSKHAPVAIGNVGLGQGVIKNYMTTNKMWGVVRPAVQIADSFSALVTTNPVSGWFWHVYNYVPGSATNSLIQEVELTYYCVFESRVPLNTS